MADRRTWGNRIMIGGGIALAIGLILRLAGGKSAESSGGDAKPHCSIWVRQTGYLNDGKPTTIADVVAGCSRVDLYAAGDAKYGDLVALRDALEAARIPYRP